MVSCFFVCSDEEMVAIVSSPEAVEIPPPLLRWWRCLHDLPGGEVLKINEGTIILPGSKYTCVMEVKVVL